VRTTKEKNVGIDVGQLAPDFTLPDQHKQVVRLSDFRGAKNVAIVFYPYAFSGICTGELCEIRDNMSVFEDDDVQVVAISCDSVHSLRAFAEAEGYAFPLLSDFWPHGAVAQSYGAFKADAGMALRGTFLVDKDGVLRWSVVNGPGEARPLAAYREALAGL
jgi:peroxiredoxin